MSLKPLYIGADNDVWYGDEDNPLTRTDTKAEVVDATVTFVLKNSAGASVATGTCPYVSGSKGSYLGVIPKATSLSDGAEYTLEITVAAVGGTKNDARKIPCQASYRGEI